MKAAEILKVAHAAGVRIALDGDDLMLEAFAPPPSAVLDLLSRHKSDVVALLRRGNDHWAGEDWRAYFDERAGMAEHDGGLSRSEAERLAFESCVSEWLDRNPEPSRSDQCAWCGEAAMTGSIVVPYGTRHHTWLHPPCWARWYQRRRAQAQAALQALGIASEPRSADDFGNIGEP